MRRSPYDLPACRVIRNWQSMSMEKDGSFLMYSMIVTFAALICYYNSLECGFVFDDMSAIVDNQDLRPHFSVRNLFWNDFWGTPMHKENSHKSYRPLCVLTFRLNYALSELHPLSYHLVNTLLHIAVCILFMRVCNLFAKDSTSFLASLLFAVHPIHTEAVTGVVGRAETLSSVFFLATLLNYSKSTGYRAVTNWASLLVTVVLVTMAMLSKEQGITVIGVCCVYEIFIVQQMTFAEILTLLTNFLKGKPRFPFWLKDSVKRAGFLVCSTLLLLFARIKVMGTQLPVFTRFDNPASMSPFPERHLTLNYLLSVNMWLLLSPSNLCCDWTMGTIPLLETVLDYRNIFTIMFYASFWKFVYYALTDTGHRGRAVLMALTLMILPFVPASNLFFPVGFVVAERILYTPSMGLCLLVATGFDVLIQYKQNLKKLLLVMMGFLLFVHTVKTVRRNYDWRSEYTLFKSGLRVNQRNAKLFNNVGHALEKEKHYTEALEYFLKASRVQPDDIGAHINVGRTFTTLNRTYEAEQAYMKAISLFPPVIQGKSYTARVAPNHLDAFLNLASLISKNASRLKEAERLYKTAISMRVDYVKAYMNRGDVFVRLGRIKEAQEQYETALKYETRDADIYYNLGVVHLEQKHLHEARNYFEEALKINPDHVQTLFNSAVLMQDVGNSKDRPEAMRRLTRLLKKNPTDSKAYYSLAMLATDDKDYTSAEKWFNKAIEYEDDMRSALFNVALMLVNDVHRPLDAVPYLEKLLKYYPKHTKGLILMGDINVNYLKDLDAAEKNFLAILEENPNNVQAFHNLCVVFVEKGDLLRGEKCLSQAHSMAPHEAYIKNHLNIVQSKIQDARQTKKVQDKNKGEKPSSEQHTPH